MPAYIYTGDDESITIRSVHFPQGKAVAVDNADLAAKLDGLSYFEVEGAETPPNASGGDVVLSEDEKDQRIVDLEAKVKGLETELATYKLAAEPENDSTPPEDAVIEIPENWAEDSHQKRISLARQIEPDLASEIKTDKDAIEVITAEIERRDNAN